MESDNVDRRLLSRFAESAAHERARRELLPPEWINAEPKPEGPGEPFEDLLERAHERVRAQRAALERTRRAAGPDRAG